MADESGPQVSQDLNQWQNPGGDDIERFCAAPSHGGCMDRMCKALMADCSSDHKLASSQHQGSSMRTIEGRCQAPLGPRHGNSGRGSEDDCSPDALMSWNWMPDQGTIARWGYNMPPPKLWNRAALMEDANIF